MLGFGGLDVDGDEPNLAMGDCQGLAALMAMNHLELEPDLASADWGSPSHLHAAIESMRYAFADALQYNADPDAVHVPLDVLLSKQYAASRRDALFNPDQVR